MIKCGICALALDDSWLAWLRMYHPARDTEIVRCRYCTDEGLWLYLGRRGYAISCDNKKREKNYDGKWTGENLRDDQRTDYDLA